MTVPGPSVRALAVDDHSGAAKTLTTLLVGEISGNGAVEAILTELTGPADTAPKFLPSGFTRADDITFTLQADEGGDPDPTNIFHVNRGGSRTVTLTHAAGWTVSFESYVTKVEPVTSVEQLSLIRVTLKPTGAITVT